KTEAVKWDSKNLLFYVLHDRGYSLDKLPASFLYGRGPRLDQVSTRLDREKPRSERGGGRHLTKSIQEEPLLLLSVDPFRRALHKVLGGRKRNEGAEKETSSQ
ncbi:unnamed protein product, partial [Gulo gulo]